MECRSSHGLAAHYPCESHPSILKSKIVPVHLLIIGVPPIWTKRIYRKLPNNGIPCTWCTARCYAADTRGTLALHRLFCHPHFVTTAIAWDLTIWQSKNSFNLCVRDHCSGTENKLNNKMHTSFVCHYLPGILDEPCPTILQDGLSIWFWLETEMQLLNNR